MTDLATAQNVRDVFLARAQAHPDRTALIIARGEEETRLTFGALAEAATRTAHHLSARFTPGTRIVLALPSGPEFVQSFLGCLFAGLIAVPVPEPGGSTAAQQRIAKIVQDCRPALTLVTSRDLDADVPGPIEAADTPHQAHAPLPTLTRDTLGVLQYSSGSTGDPKGVMISHGNILANVDEFRTGAAFEPDEIFGSWIPLHHDMGLFAFLSTALLVGRPCILMPPSDFVKRPISWLRLIDRHRITVTAAPSFAYALCLRMITDDQASTVDLSSLRYLFNGSEPIHVPTMQAFTDRFTTSGLNPTAMSAGYGLAEATVSISMRPAATTAITQADPTTLEHGRVHPTTDPQSRLLVSCGTPFACETLICDPQTTQELPPGHIGELWLRGPSVAHGYWEKPTETARTFHAAPASSPTDTTWLRTGDLATLLNNEIHITGRLKEMMVIRGRNIFPQDLEHAARAAHPLLADFVGAAFGIQAPEERVILVHEISPKARPEELPAAVAAVKNHLTGMLGTPIRDVVLLRRGTVRRTTSGKIQRSVMRSLFLAGDLRPVYAELAPEVRELISQ
ncbi:MAG: fatty acyl-AMP ligase [Catenulispora sp.]|nr:fatty acyl-AMP ligase [Catenulispora sp.]